MVAVTEWPWREAISSLHRRNCGRAREKKMYSPAEVILVSVNASNYSFACQFFSSNGPSRGMRRKRLSPFWCRQWGDKKSAPHWKRQCIDTMRIKLKRQSPHLCKSTKSNFPSIVPVDSGCHRQWHRKHFFPHEKPLDFFLCLRRLRFSFCTTVFGAAHDSYQTWPPHSFYKFSIRY